MTNEEILAQYGPRESMEYDVVIVGGGPAGMAAAIMPSAFATRSGDASLVVKPLAAPRVSRDIFVVTRRGRSIPPAGRALIEVLRDELGRTRG